MTQDRLEELMVRVVDDVATAAEREELMQHVLDKPELRAELDSHLALKAVSDGWVSRLALDAEMDSHAQRPLVRAERAIGVTLLLVGLGVVSGWGLVEVFLEPDLPIWMKLGTGAMVSGLVLLTASAIRWRLAISKSDRYSEVVR
jgi:hypothetical protein